MRHYEAIFIAHPNLEDEGLTALVNKTKAMIDKRGGEFIYEEIMGKKRLAFPVEKQKFGTYVLLQFNGDGSGNARLSQDFELSSNILAHMIVAIDEDDIRTAEVEPQPAAAEAVEPGETEKEESVALEEAVVEEKVGEEEPAAGDDSEPETAEKETPEETIEKTLEDAPEDAESPEPVEPVSAESVEPESEG